MQLRPCKRRKKDLEEKVTGKITQLPPAQYLTQHTLAKASSIVKKGKVCSIWKPEQLHVHCRSDESSESDSEDDMSNSYCTSDEEEQEDAKDYHKGAVC